MGREYFSAKGSYFGKRLGGRSLEGDPQNFIGLDIYTGRFYVFLA
ncbi:MAG: hypothetical protein ACI92G_004462 [Candidatus Pelagisphaera sp.]|jgi:hypothetical protein